MNAKELQYKYEDSDVFIQVYQNNKFPYVVENKLPYVSLLAKLRIGNNTAQIYNVFKKRKQSCYCL